MNFYDKYILPRYLNKSMSKPSTNRHRPDVVGKATGIVLEIGFGSGKNLPYYNKIDKLYAIDPSEGLHELASENIKSFTYPFQYISGSAEKLPFPDHMFDSVVSTFTLCSIPDPAAALSEIKRVLKPGGIFHFADHGISPSPTISLYQNIINPLSRMIGGDCNVNRNIEVLIKNAGLEITTLDKSSKSPLSMYFLYKGTAKA